RRGGMSGGPREGGREVAAILPNGRTGWLHVARPLASAEAMNHVARLARREGARRPAESAVQAVGPQELSAAAPCAVAGVRRRGLGRIRGLSRRIVAGDGKLDARLAKTREDLRSQLQKQFAIDRENLRRLRRRGLWDQILLATALPLFAAYGDRTNPLGT